MVFLITCLDEQGISYYQLQEISHTYQNEIKHDG